MAEVVVISGSTVGVGRAVARRFARHGAKIAILARRPDTFRTTAAELVELGAAAAFAIPCNVEDDKQVDAATKRVEQELGPIDVWVDVEDRPVALHRVAWRKWLAIGAGVTAVLGAGLVAKRVFSRTC